MVYILYFDGRCKPNPGIMGIGALVCNDEGKRIVEISEKMGDGTNNQAEYYALINGLEELSKIYIGKIIVRGDSQDVIRQMLKEYRVNKKELKLLYQRVKELEDKFQHVDYEWIPAIENEEADLLSAQAFGIEPKQRKEKRVYLEDGCTYDLIFDSEEKIITVRDEKHNRNVWKYSIKSVLKDGKAIRGSYFQSGSTKLFEQLNNMIPLEDKRIRILPKQNPKYMDFSVEEIKEG